MRFRRLNVQVGLKLASYGSLPDMASYDPLPLDASSGSAGSVRGSATSMRDSVTSMCIALPISNSLTNNLIRSLD